MPCAGGKVAESVDFPILAPIDDMLVETLGDAAMVELTTEMDLTNSSAARVLYDRSERVLKIIDALRR